jgi:beta-glucosidase
VARLDVNAMSESEALPFRDPNRPLAERVEDLLSRLTVAEKAAQMLHESPAIARLGIPAYNWWNEVLHGVARAGIATVFPQAIGLAAMWNARRLHEVAIAVSDEARAKHHEFLRHDDRGYYKGLTAWSPNINIFRDPRWGRGHETYGECPFLSARLGVAFVRGLQGDDPAYLKLVATPKHFAVHSGPEALRHSFDASVSVKDLRETYLPAFHACVTEAKAESVMGAYNRVNGEPCCASETLLARILRGEWGFRGYVVSDCWALRDIHEHHHVTNGWEESAALAVKAGCDLNCGCTYAHLPSAVARGLLDEADLDRSLTRLFRARFRLGMFDPPERVPYAQIPYEVNDCERHAELAVIAARESIVLLQNRTALLPLPSDLASIAVIGPNADDPRVLLGNYHGTPSRTVTPLAGIRAAVPRGTKVWYARGCERTGTLTDGPARAAILSEARSMAERAEVVVLCLGLDAEIEGEQGDAGNSEAAGDRVELGLPGLQQTLLETIVGVGKPTVVVLVSGSALAVGWADEHAGAVLQAFYPGQAGGTAIADVLFGKYGPAGRLPVTFPRSLDDVPDFRDYAMHGRTYRYLETEPLYPFGFGLSYTRFEYSELALSKSRLVEAEERVEISAVVANTGTRTSDEVVELFVKALDAPWVVPHHELRGFERVTLVAGEARRVSFTLSGRDFSLIDHAGRRVLEPGRFRVTVGGSQPDARSVALLGRAPLAAELELSGARREIPY